MTLAAAAATALLVIALTAGEASAAKLPKRTSAALKTLVQRTNGLPPAAASRAQRQRLRRAAAHAQRTAARKPCTAVADLARYRRVLRGVKVKGGARHRRATNRLVSLGPFSLRVTKLLLADKRTKRCGGGVAPNGGSRTTTKLLESTTEELRVRVRLPALRFVAQTGGGRAWTQLALPNTDSPSRPGTPGIPVATSTFAIPEGARLEVASANVSSYTLDGVDVFPAQPEPVDDLPRPDFRKAPFAQPAFTLDRAAYLTRGLQPPRPAAGASLGRARDLTVGSLQVPAAQYDPVKKRLRVLNSVDVSVKFNGGQGGFDPQVNSPWEHFQHTLAQSFVNAGVVTKGRLERFERCGAEMVVITNAATRAAADQLAAARRLAGLRVGVVETGISRLQIGTTAAEIQTFIRGQLNRFGCIRPSYIVLMGDDDLVPTFTATPGNIPSDLGYSLRDDADELPDVAVGRILGNDQAAVATSVTKIINYEATAPDSTTLRRATLAAQFQDDNNDGTENRTFIQFAETVRTGLVGRGVTVDRIYDDSPAATPLRFNDGTDLPAELKKPTFAWDGDGADVTAAWNAGRFLMVHRDHGWSDGWGHPLYTTANVDALTNGSKLPVLMSINCSSAAYDYDETSFVSQALVNPNGGAVGAFGDTRDSPSWHNTQIALGFVDGLLPSILPSEGPASKQRVGQALIHGKLRLAGLSSPTTDGNTRKELYLWHYFGDPSMQMWGGDPPRIFDITRFKAVYKEINSPDPDPPPYWVEVTLPPELAGQPVALLRDGQVIGKAIAGAGSVQIPATFGNSLPDQNSLEVAIEVVGAEPLRVPVTGVPSF